MNFPPADLNIPQGRVAWPDETVPRKDALYNMYWEPDVADHQPPRPQGYRDQYPEHTRVIHHQSKLIFFFSMEAPFSMYCNKASKHSQQRPELP